MPSVSSKSFQYHKKYSSGSKVVKHTSLKEAMASTTSFVKALPTPEVPIRTVGLID
jgi:hypothetical protein